MEILNYTYNEYINLKDPDEIDRVIFVLRYASDVNTSEDVYKVGPFTEQPFGWVKDVQHAYAQDGLSWVPFLELFAQATGNQQPANLPLFDLRREMLYFGEQIKGINAAEASLAGAASSDEIMADPSGINKLGAFVQFSELAGGDVTKIAAVQATKYGLCFAELKLRHETSLYQKRLNKILSRKK